MKRLALSFGFAAALLALAPGLITGYGGSVQAAFHFPVTLTGPNENPPNNSLGIGTGFVDIDSTAHTFRVSVTFSGLTGTTTMAHIHCCVTPPGIAGVATTVPT